MSFKLMSTVVASAEGAAEMLLKKKTRTALVGAGSRAAMYVQAVLGARSDTAELVAIADVNPGRTAYYVALTQRLRDESAATSGAAAAPLPAATVFDPTGLTAFIREHAIDRVIVTTPDYTHADYIVEALNAGADVVVEKPLTIDVDGCRRITAANEETGRDVVVTFNYRYSPRNSALKEISQSGVIGKVTSVDFSLILIFLFGQRFLVKGIATTGIK